MGASLVLSKEREAEWWLPQLALIAIQSHQDSWEVSVFLKSSTGRRIGFYHQELLAGPPRLIIQDEVVLMIARPLGRLRPVDPVW
jgi:hypothetical protein